MPQVITHTLVSVTPDNPAYEIKPSNWNATHTITGTIDGADILSAFSTAGNVAFSLDGSGDVEGNVPVIDITGLPNATLPLSGTELAIVSQGGVDSQVAVSNFGQTTSVALVAGSTAAATANTAAIQAALSVGGVVNITEAGIFYINATLYYQSNTTVVLGPNTTIRLAPNSNCSMLMSVALQTMLNGGLTLTGGTAVTLTQGVGSAVNVNWTGHGFSVGQGVWIAGAVGGGVQTNAYNGVFRVAAVVDANNFTIYTNYFITTAPTGSPLAVEAVQNFNLYGGTWDQDYASQSGIPTYSYNAISLHLSGMIDSTISNVRSINSQKYNFEFQFGLNIHVTDIIVNSISDGVHVYGPMTSLTIDGEAGVATDDFLILDTANPSVYAPYQFSAYGDIIDVTARHLNPNSQTTSNPFRILAGDYCYQDRILVDGLSGGSQNRPLFLGPSSGGTTNAVGRVTLRNVQKVGSGTFAAQILISGITADMVTIEDTTFTPNSTAEAAGDNFLTIDTAATIRQLVLNRVNSNGWSIGAGSVIFAYINSAKIKSVVVRDCTCVGGNGSINYLDFQNAANTLGDVTFDGGSYDSGVLALVSFPTALASGTPNLKFKNIETSGYPFAAVRTTALQNVNVYFEGGNWLFNSAAIFTNVSNTIVVRSNGANNYNAIAPVLISAGTPIITMYGYDLAFDAGLLATTKGQYFTHASAVAGRNAANQQGPCIAVDGTHFYALGTGTGGVNTLIV